MSAAKQEFETHLIWDLASCQQLQYKMYKYIPYLTVANYIPCIMHFEINRLLQAQLFNEFFH